MSVLEDDGWRWATDAVHFVRPDVETGSGCEGYVSAFHAYAAARKALPDHPWFWVSSLESSVTFTDEGVAESRNWELRRWDATDSEDAQARRMGLLA